MYYAPTIIREGNQNQLVLARYHCRPRGKPASIDRQFPSLYNARRDNLEKFWRNEFGHSHALVVMDAFVENVERDGKNVVLRFEPNPPKPMLVACPAFALGQGGERRSLADASGAEHKRTTGDSR